MSVSYALKPVSDWVWEPSLHTSQLNVFHDPHKFRVLVCGRRYGKSTLQATDLAMSGIQFPELMPDYRIKDYVMETAILAGMPTLKQARKILWRPLLKILENCPLVKSVNRTDNIITFEGNRPQIHVVGLNDSEGDRARGMKLWRSNIDEIQDVKKSVLDTVVLPAMADTPGSRGLFTGTPKGKTNHLYELYNRASTPGLERDWQSFNFPTWSNYTIPNLEEEIARAKAVLSPRLFAQEFCASFVNFEGQVFSEFDDELDVIPVERLPQSWDSFYIGHDCGDVNPAVVLVGLSENTFYVLDVWQPGNGSDPIATTLVYDHIKSLTRRYPKTYQTMVDPSRPGVINDLRTLGRLEDIDALKRTIKGYNPIEEGNNTVNNLFHQHRLKISSACGTRFIDELLSYHRAKDTHDNIIEKIAPGQKDHAIDALRYVLATLHTKGARHQSL